MKACLSRETFSGFDLYIMMMILSCFTTSSPFFFQDTASILHILLGPWCLAISQPNIHKCHLHAPGLGRTWLPLAPSFPSLCHPHLGESP